VKKVWFGLELEVHLITTVSIIYFSHHYSTLYIDSDIFDVLVCGPFLALGFDNHFKFRSIAEPARVSEYAMIKSSPSLWRRSAPRSRVARVHGPGESL